MTLKNPPLHHVGIVQPDEETALTLMALLGLSEAYRGTVESFHALCIFTEAAGRSPIEFVVPNGGPLERFNKGAGDSTISHSKCRTSSGSPKILPAAACPCSNGTRSRAPGHFCATSSCPRRRAESSWNMCR